MTIYFLIAVVITLFLLFIFSFNRLIDRAEQKAGAIEENLQARFVFYNIKQLLFFYYPAVVIIFVAAILLTGLYWLAIVFVVFLVLPTIVIKVHNQKRLDEIEKQLPDALMMISGALRSGASLNAALQQLASEMPLPLSQEISLLVREQKVGVTLDEALQNFQNRIPINAVVLVVTAIRISNEAGGELAEALSRTASTLKQIEQAEGKIKALTAQGKMQAWVVGAMPLGLMFILSKMEPEAMSQLWTTHAGWLALGAIAAFEVVGVWMIRKIVNIDV